MAVNRNIKQGDNFLEKAIRGDKAGIEYLVRTYQNLAYTIAIKIVLNKEDAEEVVQDSFMKAFASLSKFRKASKFSTWLYRIVYNTAITKINRKAIKTIDLNESFKNSAYITADHDQWYGLIQEERKKYVGLALERLTHEDRLVITLYYLGEMDISEICEVMNMKKSAVKMRLLRGRKQLEHELTLLLNTEMKNLL